MNERYKIGEAKFFLERMEESVENRDAFRYYLSAFLTAAQSILQYARKESREKCGQKWYDTTVAGNDVLRFFRDRRNVNIHEEPVNPARDVTIAISEGVIAFSSVASVVLFNDKPVGMRRPEEEPPPPKPPESRSKTTVRYRFNDWTGPEDLIGLSHRYIEALESFVQRGMEQEILSG